MNNKAFLWAGGLFLSAALSAQTFQLGGHIGSVGIGESSDIAFGVNMTSNPYGWAGFRIDATTASLEGGTYYSSSPALIVYPVAFEEVQLGFLAGAGFYKIPGQSTQFGLNFGALGEFALSKSFSVGLESRMHSVFNSEDVWSVYLTAGFKFDTGGDW